MGSGLSGSTYADNVVNKTADGLPIIPGKTIKGLFRDAAQQILKVNEKALPKNFIEKVFGTIKKPSMCFFTNATLSQNLSDNIIASKLTGSLYNVLSATKINDAGQAEDGSLRHIEVTIPLFLYGEILHVEADYKDGIEKCAKWIRRMGVNRNRGLGRCTLKLIEK
jgi:CRISPR/Cas system CSM-associated protein Csm3 (group 7 of RAMP superfamily)